MNNDSKKAKYPHCKCITLTLSDITSIYILFNTFICNTLENYLSWKKCHQKFCKTNPLSIASCKKKKYTKQGKKFEWHIWWWIKRKCRSYMLKRYWVTLLLRGESQGISVPLSCLKWTVIILAHKMITLFNLRPYIITGI